MIFKIEKLVKYTYIIEAESKDQAEDRLQNEDVEPAKVEEQSMVIKELVKKT